MVVRSDYLVRQSKLPNKVHGPGLHGDEAIGTGFDETTVLASGLDDAAKLRRFFNQCGTNARFGKVVSGGEAGDSAADNQRLVRHKLHLKLPNKIYHFGLIGAGLGKVLFAFSAE